MEQLKGIKLDAEHSFFTLFSIHSLSIIHSTVHSFHPILSSKLLSNNSLFQPNTQPTTVNMFTKTAIFLAAANLAAAHTTFQSFVIDGKDQGQHFAVEVPSNGNNPILDVTDAAMVCNGGKPTTDSVEVAAGSSIGFQWHHNDPATVSGDSDEPIAASHKGPVMVYIAKAEGNGEGAVWQKIYEDGLTGTTWGVDTFIKNKGLITIDLPNLEPGDYLIRPEMIGLHEATTQGKAQFYNGCGAIKITGSGTLSLPAEGTDMTKAYKATEAGVMFNIYGGETSYPIPGPKVWTGAGSGSAPSTPSTTASPASSAAPTSSAAPSRTATPVASSAPAASSVAAAPSATASPVEEAAPATSSAAAGGNALPEKFTIEEFITWLKATAGSSSSKARRHARAFHF
jgi:cellulase